MKLKNLLAVTIIFVTLLCCGITASATTYNGTCGVNGDNVTWKYDTATYTLTISGVGDMKDYYNGINAAIDRPWKNYMSSIKKVIVEQGITRIGSFAFSALTQFESIALPEGLTTIGMEAFSRGSLSSITIPKSIIKIEKNAFVACNQLVRVNISDIRAWCEIDFEIDGLHTQSNPLYHARKLYLNDTLVTDIVFPNGMTHINPYAFYWCRDLKTIVIPEGVTRIGTHAFNITGLQQVTLPSTLTTIGSSAFRTPYNETINNVYYNGTQTKWNLISIGSGNENLTSSAIHYKSTYTFHSNGGNEIDPITDYRISNLPIPAKDNMIFLGWYANKDLTGIPISQYFSSSENITLYAKWGCTITYIGDLEDSFTVEEGNNIELPTAPEGYEYRFYTDGEEWNGKNITGNVTVEVELINLATQCDILSIKSPTGGTLIEQSIDFKVANNLTSITPEFSLSAGATWKMYRNSTFTSENTSKTLNNLVAGAEPRTAYIRVTAADGTTTKDYTISVYRNTKAAPPTVTINGATVTITSESGDIYYTTDGSEPTANSLKYTESFTAKSEAVIKAIVIDSAKDEYSDITTNTVPKYITTTLEKDYLSIDANAKTASFGFIITSNGEPTGIFIVALYDESGCLVGCKTVNISTATDYVEDNTLIYSGTPHTYKAFFWNSLNTLTPMCESIGSEI